MITVGLRSLASLVLAVSRGPHGVLNPAGPQASRIEALFWLEFWICLIVFVVVTGAFWWGGHRDVDIPRDSRNVIEENPADKTAAWFVVAAVAITTVILFVVLIESVRAGRFVQAQSPANALTINVTGHQWFWEVVYPNSEPDLQITTANEIHVPTHETITIVTRSADVIHSFWAPNITGKRDLIPGYASSFSFEIDTPGDYRGQCAEFCGIQHAHMGFLIVAEPREDFDRWAAAQIQDATEPTTPQARHGRDVFLTHQCVMCHAIQGTEAGSRMGPDLTHIASRKFIAANTLPNVPGALGGWILDPQTIKPGTHMAINALKGDDLNDLLAYLSSLN